MYILYSRVRFTALFLLHALVFLYGFGGDGSGYFGGVIAWCVCGCGGVGAPCFASYEACDEGKAQKIDE